MLSKYYNILFTSPEEGWCFNQNIGKFKTCFLNIFNQSNLCFLNYFIYAQKSFYRLKLEQILVQSSIPLTGFHCFTIRLALEKKQKKKANINTVYCFSCSPSSSKSFFFLSSETCFSFSSP